MREPALVPRELWLRAAAARHRFLMLDYDGTLAPFRVNRLEAVPPADLLDLLERVAASESTRLAVISGRPVRELARVLGHLPAILVGEHGWEKRSPGGRIIRYPLPKGVSESLASAEAAVMGSWRGRLERKRSSLVVHTRGLGHATASRIEISCALAWRSIAERGGLRLQAPAGSIELRATGRDKGSAVRDLMRSSRPGTLHVYIGDDETDEDAFAALRRRGFGLLVARTKRPSHARGRLRSRDEMRAFLAKWLALEAAGGDARIRAPSRGRKP